MGVSVKTFSHGSTRKARKRVNGRFLATDEHGSFLNEALSVSIRVYPWLGLSSFGVARSDAS